MDYYETPEEYNNADEIIKKRIAERWNRNILNTLGELYFIHDKEDYYLLHCDLNKDIVMEVAIDKTCDSVMEELSYHLDRLDEREFINDLDNYSILKYGYTLFDLFNDYKNCVEDLVNDLKQIERY